MITETALLKNRYFDSVFLMRVAKRMGEQPGIEQAAVVMGTPKNIRILAEAGYDGIDALGASSNDLVVSLKAESLEEARLLLDSVEQWLVRDSVRPGAKSVRSIDQALAQQPGSNLVLISVPGEFAAREARVESVSMKIWRIPGNRSNESGQNGGPARRSYAVSSQAVHCATKPSRYSGMPASQSTPMSPLNRG